MLCHSKPLLSLEKRSVIHGLATTRHSFPFGKYFLVHLNLSYQRMELLSIAFQARISINGIAKPHFTGKGNYLFQNHATLKLYILALTCRNLSRMHLSKLRGLFTNNLQICTYRISEASVLPSFQDY